MAIALDEQLCLGCGCCSDACSSGALELGDRAIYNEEHCNECESCIEMCPVGALTET